MNILFVPDIITFHITPIYCLLVLYTINNKHLVLFSCTKVDISKNIILVCIKNDIDFMHD